MNVSTVYWTYSLSDDVNVEPGAGGAYLHTAFRSDWVETGDDAHMLELLSSGTLSEEQIDRHQDANITRDGRENNASTLLYRLDRLGFLVRHLSAGDRQLASCVPSRPPPDGLFLTPPSGLLKLSPLFVARANLNVFSLEVPGSWATVLLNDRNLLCLLHDLSIGKTSSEIVAATADFPEAAVLMLLSLLSWCGLFDGADSAPWSSHELHFHTRTRAGYARVPPHKSPLGECDSMLSEQLVNTNRVALQAPDNAQLISSDPPYGKVMEQRRSTRSHGKHPLDAKQLSEFLFRTFIDRAGRRPFPSGGACYPLNTYVIVSECAGIASGCYLYDPTAHELITIADSGPGVDQLLADAAGVAEVSTSPQILIVLAARVKRAHAVYPDLGYNLILKEVGAVFQTAMMNAAVMNIGTCPLGCGNSIVFSEIIGIDPIEETSVGELMLGSLP